MQIKSITLKNFRNHKNLSLAFQPGINFLCGQNAKGKTNILEAIYFFATTKSFRTSKENLVIKENEEAANVKMEIEKGFGTVNFELQIGNNSKKFIINSEKMSQMSKVLGNFCAILFSPDELKIIKGGPEERRNFIDTAISELSGAYYDLLSRFEKVLFSRNLLLKRNAPDSELEIYDEQFAILSAKILKQRQIFIEKLIPFAQENMLFLSANKDDLKIKYDSPFKGNDIKDQIMDALGASRLRDRELGYTTTGPHRDDLIILSDKKDLRHYGSQGQQRTAVLALKLAIYNVTKETIGEEPVLLLDDVFSELDGTRAKLLFEKVRGCQTIITGTRARASLFNYNKIKI